MRVTLDRVAALALTSGASLLLHFQRGAGEDLNHPRFGLSVRVELRERGLAQVTERGFDQGRHGAPIVAIAPRHAPPSRDAFADGREPVEQSVGAVAVRFEVRT